MPLRAFLALLLFAATAAEAQTAPQSVATGAGRPIALEPFMPRPPAAYPNPKSDWQEREKALYRTLLTKGDFDVLVVPVEVQQCGFDRATRSLMTAQLTLALSAAPGAKVPDPYLAARALGDGARMRDSAEVFRFAEELKVKQVVRVFAGHDCRGRMAVTVFRHDRNPDGKFVPDAPTVKRDFEDQAFSDEDPPIEAFAALLPQLVATLGRDASLRPRPQRYPKASLAALPASPMPAAGKKPDPVTDAYHLQLLAAMAPMAAERARERLFERSLLATARLAPDSPDYPILKARAFLHLGLRPAALRVLGQPKNVEERALVARLNGDLPELEKLSAQIKSPVHRLLASIELNELRGAYEVNSRPKVVHELESFSFPSEAWATLVAQRFMSWDIWTVGENAELKRLLDRDLPLPGFSAESIARGAAALGGGLDAGHEFDLAVYDHVRRSIEGAPGKWCCAPPGYGPATWDYVVLLEGIATENLRKRAQLYDQVQALPERAIGFLDSIDPVFKGHPGLTVSRARAQAALAATAQGTAREGLLRGAYENAYNALVWEQGQTFVGGAAWGVLTSLRIGHPWTLDNFYLADHPFKPEWPIWAGGLPPAMAAQNAEAALRNATFQFPTVKQRAHFLSPAQVEGFLTSLGPRFQGSPERGLYLASVSLQLGNRSAAKDHYRAGIKAQPDAWTPYIELGTMLVEDGDYKSASELLSGFPGFKGAAEEAPVALSNYANEAGSLFYWRGDSEAARPFYRIATDLRTGSDSDMTAALRLALLDADYVAAAAGSLERARRYNSPYAFRDYLGLLFLLGHSKQAWAAFETLAPRLHRPHVWHAALTGHQLDDASEAKIAAWLKQEHLRQAGDGTFSFAARYLLTAGVTDRKPSKELAARIAELDRPVYLVPGHGRAVVRRDDASGYYWLLGPSAAEKSYLPLGVFERGPVEKVKSDLVYFAEAYHLIGQGDFAAAASRFKDAATLYNLSQERLGYLLPYYAWAAGKSGDFAAVEQYLQTRVPLSARRFDYYLAKGVLDGLRGRADEAAAALRDARNRFPFTEDRPIFTEYQFAEICEWLYRATSEPRYRELALDWARKYQRLQPWQAWAYSMEAVLAPAPEDRRRALAIALYLDRGSERLRSVPRQEREAAAKWFEQNNPFEAAAGKPKSRTES